MNNYGTKNGGVENLAIKLVKLPGDLAELFSATCFNKSEIGFRAYALQVVPRHETLDFIRLLTFEEHLAVAFLINDGYHRQEAAALVYMGECGANEGDEDALIPKAVAGGEIIRILGSIILDEVKWTIWGRHDAPRPRDPLLAFSVVRYDASTNTARPWS